MPFEVADAEVVGVVLVVGEVTEGSVDALRPEGAPTVGFFVAVDMAEGFQTMLLVVIFNSAGIWSRTANFL